MVGKLGTRIQAAVILLMTVGDVNAFQVNRESFKHQNDIKPRFCLGDATKFCQTMAVSALVAASLSLNTPPAVWAADSSGASSSANAKITTGGASTLQSGRTIAITRGVNLDNSDFSGQNLKGVAFQQSIVRDSNFKGSNLIGASFFDATLGECLGDHVRPACPKVCLSRRSLGSEQDCDRRLNLNNCFRILIIDSSIQTARTFRMQISHKRMSKWRNLLEHHSRTQ